jgi:hypothetical protein
MKRFSYKARTRSGQAVADGWLLPIKAEHQINREDLEGLQPFFWER